MPELCTCKHPKVEHAEGGRCKVKDCECMGFQASGEQAVVPGETTARHTVMARATDETGEQGCQLTASGPGRPVDVPKPILQNLAHTVRAEYERLYDGEAPAHVGITALPYMAGWDDMDDDAEIAAGGIEVSSDCTDEEAIDALAEAAQLFADSEMRLRAKDRLALALREVSPSLAAKAVRGGFPDPEALRTLALELGELGNSPAHILAHQIRQGEFDPEGDGGS